MSRVKSKKYAAKRVATNERYRIKRYMYHGTISIKKVKFRKSEPFAYLLNVQAPEILGVSKTYKAIVVNIKKERTSNIFGGGFHKRHLRRRSPSVRRYYKVLNTITIIDNDNDSSINISKEIFFDTTTKNGSNRDILYTDGKQSIKGKIVKAKIIGGGATGPATDDGLPPIDE